jgi:hypothetical protein
MFFVLFLKLFTYRSQFFLQQLSTYFMDNSLIQILNETTRVWRKGGKLLKNINAKSLLKI